jgi:hypothetical protein
LSFAFYSPTIDKQQDLGDNWQINVHKNFYFVLKKLCHYFQTYENTVMLRMTKQNWLLQILWVLHFIAATIEKQQGLGQLTNKCSQELYFVLKTASHYFPDLWKHCWALRMTKAKIDFCKFLSFAFYSRHNWETTRFRDNWQINVHKNFILYWKQPLFPRPMKTPVGAKNDKAKIRLLQIFWVLHFIAATIDKQQDRRQLTNKCSQELYFVLKTAFAIISRPMKHC